VTIQNKDLFSKDPTQSKIPNDGVSKVVRPETEQQWAVLDWELKSFVCEGEYERGLERILNSYVSNLGKAQQPAVWVSGFYGSGKSHLCRVLEYLWRDVELPGGQSARQLVHLPSDIQAHFRELSVQGKRHGGLWSAAGTLGAGRSQAVRLAFLSVLFEAAGLPQKYQLAKFTIWAQDNGYLNAIKAAIEAGGKTYDDEVANLYVSPIIAKALLDADPTLGDSVKDVRKVLQTQFPSQAEDISDDEMFETVEDVLRLQSDSEGRYPLTLIVLDEMQQYLGDDNAKTLAVQNIVEGVSSRFDNTVLFIASGQSAMGGTPTLQKLTDRFPVHVHLSDKDVETVVREVILRKQPDRVNELKDVLQNVSGEIDRHLGGTRIAPVAADKDDLVPDYPLLPTRRRFWELALRALDKAGKAGVLRTQLRIVHEAARAVAEQPVGHVVGADFLYHQQAATLQMSGDLLKEISDTILALRDQGPDGELKSRICALVFLINEIPAQTIGAGETGLKATADYIADLLVEDLREGGAGVRKRVPELLEQLTDSGELMRIGEEYRLETEEGAEWTKDYRRRLSAFRDDAAKLATLRNERLYSAVDKALGGVKLTQGESRTPRKISLHYGSDEPTAGEAAVAVWIRDEWSVTESSVKNAAAQAGDDDPVVHVILPKRDQEAVKEALASHAAAQETINARPTPQTDEGKQAQRAMYGRVASDEETLSRLFGDVVAGATVYQGGGSIVTAASLRDAVELAAERSLVRLFPKFGVADNSNWGKVVTLARDGAPDALNAVGHTGEVLTHPVCKEVLSAISAGGTSGSDVRVRYANPPFGWDEEAIRGALMALLATQHIRAAQEGKALTSQKQLEPRQIARTTFYKEDPPPSATQRMAVRGLLTTAEIKYENGQEQVQIPALLQHLIDLAAAAGGQPPLPQAPDTAHIRDLQALSGNQQFHAVADAHSQLKDDLEAWRTNSEAVQYRQKAWTDLESLLRHAQALSVHDEVAAQRDAIRDGRQLLDDPDPVRPLLETVITALREAVVAGVEQLRAHHDEVIKELEASDEWKQLDDGAWQEIISTVGLERPPDVDVSTQEQLIAQLNSAPLTTWKERTEVVRARATRAREEAARKLEPTAIRVQLGSATIKTPADVDAYLGQARERLLKAIEDGATVIL
jgi:hypothetical protein